jgi:hypothetical protein
MSYGFEATNNSGDVLISSETRNLHFLGKYSSPSVTNSATAYGGFKELSYTITSTVIPVPFFDMPTTDYYGIIGVKNTTGNTWVVKVIRSGTSSTYPSLYVFVDARGVSSSEGYGMQVLQDDGSASFDSRKEPLVITGGTAVTHPSNPLTSSITGLNSVECGSGSTHNQHTPDNESSAYSVGTLSSTPIFHYSSLAQAERRANFSGSEESCLGISAYGGCIGYGETDSWVSTYWAFYRGGIRLSGTNVYAGWVTVLGGCYWSSYSDNDFFGIDVGGGSSGGGSFPYTNETLNLASTAVIVGDGTRYA